MSSGQEVRYPAFTTPQREERAGLHRAVWRKAIRCWRVASGGGAYGAMFAWSCGVWWDVRTVVGGSTVHKGLDGILVPFNTIVLLRMMTMLFF